MFFGCADLRRVRIYIAIAGFVILFSGLAMAQDSSSSSSSGRTFTVIEGPPPKANSKSPYITSQDGPPIDEVNRKALESRAGLNGGKMMLRSIPTGARIFVNDEFVGRAPLLLVVAPGRYRVQMHGDREASAERSVAVAPKETQEVALTLLSRYPDRVTTH